MNETKVSVIVPVYNAEHGLEKCIKSICVQSVPSLELILVDDGSTDRSGEICDEWAQRDPRIRVIHGENGGVSTARNRGIAVADGAFITFCDSDDYLEPDYLAALLRAEKENPACGHIWCCFQTVDSYHNVAPNYVASEPIQYYTLHDYMTLHELWLDTGPCNKLYRMETIRAGGIRFPEELSLGEDWMFNLDYLDSSRNDRIAVVTKPLYNYVRNSEESLDTRYREDLLDIYRKLNAACYMYLKKWQVSSEQMEKFCNSRFYLYEKVLRNTMRGENMSRRKQIAWNNAFMRSEEFRKALKERSCYVHPMYLMAYRSGYFAVVLWMDRLHRLKRKIKRN